MLYESQDKMVSHPSHYKSGRLEVIDVIKAFTKDLKGIEATDTGNIIKYACRWDKKGKPIQDCEKIIWYATHLLNELKSKQFVEITEAEVNKLYGIETPADLAMTPCSIECEAKATWHMETADE